MAQEKNSSVKIAAFAATKLYTSDQEGPREELSLALFPQALHTDFFARGATPNRFLLLQ